MSLREMKDDLHDALWRAQQDWFAMREEGETKHDLKMAGLRDAGDPNAYTRGVIFTGCTRLTYERDLREFVKFCHALGVQKLRDIDAKHARAYLDKAIAEGWAAKTLHKLRSELVKLGALIGKTASFVALSKEYGEVIRELEKGGVVDGPTRETPSADVVARATEILRERDERYYLAARLQQETAGRSVSCTDRITKESLKDGNVVEIVGKSELCCIPMESHDDMILTAPRPLEQPMVDRLTAERRSWNMSRIRHRDTTPELAVCECLTRLGVRFRTHHGALPGTPDVVLPRRKLVIFVHGCFWHRHAGCKFAYMPKSRVGFWIQKFEDNVSRDKRTRRALRKQGWRTTVVWECQTRDAARLVATLERRVPSSSVAGSRRVKR